MEPIVSGAESAFEDVLLDDANGFFAVWACDAGVYPRHKDRRGSFMYLLEGGGSIVDEAALAKALITKKIAGAVLDVTQEEPLPLDHEFWRCPNTLLTQHSGGGTSDELDRKIDVFLANFDRYRRGERLQNIVDFDRGY